MNKPEKKELLEGEDCLDAFTANDMNRACNEVSETWQAYHEEQLQLKQLQLDQALKTAKEYHDLTKQIEGKALAEVLEKLGEDGEITVAIQKCLEDTSFQFCYERKYTGNCAYDIALTVQEIINQTKTNKQIEKEKESQSKAD